MKHKGCGGIVIAAPNGEGYHFEGEDAKQFGTFVPKYVCKKCGIEIVGDAQIEDLQEVLVGGKLRFTQRGFENFARLIDTHNNLVVVRQSSQTGGPYVWIFSRANDDVAGLACTAPHLNAAQARELATALMVFASREEER